MVDDIAKMIKEKLGNLRPEIGLVLGSGLGFFADDHMDVDLVIPYAEIKAFPQSTIAGHKGNLVFGRIADKQVVCMQGRFHYYEGYSLAQVTLGVRVMAALGVSDVVFTNAAGGIHPKIAAGSFMLIDDHINMLGANPLIGPNSGGERFPDMSNAYDPGLKEKALAAAEACGITLERGIYLATSGPCYETPAEVRMFAQFGADAVGMSTVPEVIVARHAGLRVCGISCITNAAAGINQGELSHTDVVSTANRVQGDFARLLKHLIPKL